MQRKRGSDSSCGSTQGDLSWQAVLRALCAVEAVIQQGSTAACGEIAVYFQVHDSPVKM